MEREGWPCIMFQLSTALSSCSKYCSRDLVCTICTGLHKFQDCMKHLNGNCAVITTLLTSFDVLGTPTTLFLPLKSTSGKNVRNKQMQANSSHLIPALPNKPATSNRQVLLPTLQQSIISASVSKK
ncbi:hypothetical protein CEXT_238871 [Caerostris extrusa]|uniref:Uncharacterized protein n=1 Tax=Caerostris extrusa TaxID=172846 RepID=A0AAV4R8M9_CAEEX|nr:hypothetical protein CEXT_238871 [Caerostris extrusa]